jgi:ATP-binding cassette subfamily B protein
MMTRTEETAPVAGRIRPQPATVRRAIRYLRGEATGVALLTVIIVADSFLVIVPPLLFQRIIDDAVIPGDARMLSLLCLVAFGVMVLSAGSGVGVSWGGSLLGGRIMHRIRSDVFAHTQRLPVAFYTGQRSGALISRLTNDTTFAQAAVSNVLPQLSSSVVRLMFVVVAMALLSWPTLLMLAPLPLLLVLPVRLVGRKLHRISHEAMTAQAQLTSYATERLNVAGAMLGQLYGTRSRDHAGFASLSGRDREINVRMTAVASMFSAGLGLLSSAAVVALYLLGGFLVIGESITVGTLVALAALVPQLFGPVRALSGAQVHIMKTVASFDRIFELLDREPARDRSAEGRAPACDDGTVEFAGVHFAYRPQWGLDDEAAGSRDARPLPVLRGLSFQVERGQRIGVVGPSGAGKSTMAALLPRLYDVDAGAVRVGGADVRDIPLATLRDKVGVLTQDSYLFHDTIRANLLYAAPEAGEVELVAACEAARIWPLIRTLPDGLDTVVGDRGYRFSGGEKQRLAIARLLLKDPSVVILDEATAHLDNDSERAVQEALDQCLVGRTTLVIAHRLSTVRDADWILVLDQGRVAERGTHDELIARGGIYAALHRDQHASRRPQSVAEPVAAVAA